MNVTLRYCILIYFKIKLNLFLKVFTVFRISYIILQVGATIFINESTSPFQGPMKLFMGSFTYGRYICVAIQLFVMNRKETRQQLLKLMNLLSIQTSPNYKSFQIMNNENLKSKEYRKTLILLDFVFHYILIISAVLQTTLSQIISAGYRKSIVDGWNFAGKVLGMPMSHYRNMTWWMKVSGFLLTYMHLDYSYQMGSSVAAVFFVARTLQDFSRHFIENVEHSKMYCNVLRDEVSE